MEQDKKTVKKSWERRSLGFILRFCGVILFIAYLFAVSPIALSWGKMQWIRTQSLDDLPAVAEKTIAQDTPKKLLEWISLRPREERAEIMKRLEPYSGKVSSYIFMTFSQWSLDMDKPEDGVFWRQYGLFRLRFDSLRCGAPNSMENMTGLVTLFPSRRVQRYIDAHPEIAEKSVHDVLKYDEKHPAENIPSDTCPMLQKIENEAYRYEMVPHEKWQEIRFGLRFATELSLEQAEKDRKAEKHAAPAKAAPKTQPKKD